MSGDVELVKGLRDLADHLETDLYGDEIAVLVAAASALEALESNLTQAVRQEREQCARVANDIGVAQMELADKATTRSEQEARVEAVAMAHVVAAAIRSRSNVGEGK